MELGKKASDPKQVYEAVIYNDQIGEIEFKGKLQLSAGELDSSAYRDPKSFSAWDGNTLHLRDGRQLTALNDTDTGK